MIELNYSDRPVLVSDGERKLRIDLQKVSYIEVDNIYCKFFTWDNKELCKVRQTLGVLEECLSDRVFVRIRRSVIINVWDVDQIMGKMIYMKGGNFYEVAARYEKAFSEHFIVLKEKRPQRDS